MAAPKLLCDTAGMSREKWLKARMHGPKGDIEYTIGGSDVSVIFGINPWTTPLELWRIKKGLMEPPASDNEDALDMGHLMEPIVAHWYEKKEGHAVIADTGLYQHADYPYALANLDYRMKDKDTGEPGVFECKSTGWRNAEHWEDGAVPPYYELQVRFYLAVMDLNLGDISCMWGLNPNNERATQRIHRDKAVEALIFERCDEFIQSLRSNTPPTMTDVADPKLAMQALARLYGKSKKGLPTVEFGKKQERSLRCIAALQLENAGYREAINKNEREITAHSVRIAEMMKEHEHGVLETPKDRLLIDYVTKITRRPDSAKLKKDYKAVYDDVLKASESRKLQVTVDAKPAI